MKETLSLDYILKHEPFEEFPLKYYTNSSYYHKPSILDYGVALTAEKVKGYARKNGIIPEDVEHPTPTQQARMYGVIPKKLNDRYKPDCVVKRLVDVTANILVC